MFCSFSMAYQRVCLVFVSLVCVLDYCAGQYAVPEIKFEAFTPKGLRISIPAEKGVELFAFHGKLNKAILQIEPGEFSEDVTRPANGRFTYINPSIKLKEGDVIHYWVFVQHEQLGFRKDDQQWTVDKLLPQEELERAPGQECTPAISKILGKNVKCSGDSILNYRFTESTLNADIWLVEQFIPSEPDWEYVVYKNDPDVVKVENNALRIRPKVAEDMAKQDIIISGCTRTSEMECNRPFQVIVQPFIVSGRVVSKDAFSFGTISVKAKLPQGDWVFPEIYLEDINDPRRRILLAYARGNKVLTEFSNNKEIGGKLLLGGPYTDPRSRNTFLKDYLGTKHVGDDWHVFTVKWAKDQMELSIDDTKYGVITADALRSTGFLQDTLVRLVLGVGVGGATDFPDNSVSGQDVKPWKSSARNATKGFLNQKATWQKTWNADTQLLVEYVTIKAL